MRCSMCEVYYDDGDLCSVWQETQQRARKGHWCSCCRGLISPGEVYVRHFSIYDHSVTSEKCCMPCFEAGESYQNDHGMKWVPSMMWEEIRECLRNGGREEKWGPIIEAMEARHAAGVALRASASASEDWCTSIAPDFPV